MEKALNFFPTLLCYELLMTLALFSSSFHFYYFARLLSRDSIVAAAAAREQQQGENSTTRAHLSDSHRSKASNFPLLQHFFWYLRLRFWLASVSTDFTMRSWWCQTHLLLESYQNWWWWNSHLWDVSQIKQTLSFREIKQARTTCKSASNKLLSLRLRAEECLTFNFFSCELQEIKKKVYTTRIISLARANLSGMSRDYRYNWILCTTHTRLRHFCRWARI